MKRVAGRSAIAALSEAGGYRAKFPMASPAATHALETVLVNTGGGLLGGDKVQFAFEIAPEAQLIVTTQSAEKVYRALDAPAELAVAVTVGAGASLAWLPQPSILFAGARLSRRIEVDMAADSSVILAESTVFGRSAMGEAPGTGEFADSWRVRRDGRLVYAEETRLDGDLGALLDRPACGAGARAAATVLIVDSTAESRLDALRERIAAHPGIEAGASAWNGLAAIRALATAPERMVPFLADISTTWRASPPPRSWQT